MLLFGDTSNHCLANWAVADEVNILDECCGVHWFAVDLFEHFAVVVLQPAPIAKLVEMEVLGVEDVHCAFGAETVGNNGDTIVSDGLVATLQLHNIGVELLGEEVVLVSTFYACGANDKVGS